MAVIKCKMCGGDLLLTEGSTVAECEYCGSVQTVPTADNEKKLTLFARANRLRAANEFDKAAGVYESIVADFPEEAEAYWGLVLCKFGIEYVDDPATGKKVPTCHRSGFDSVMKDSDFEQACENADPTARRVYREEAKQIEEIRKRIIEVSCKEEPYDIFICYKETNAGGKRTVDSVIAQNVYDKLTESGYRVFFSRITLEDKLGLEYEPYIFAALNSAKVMLVFGTDYEHFNAVWVKNEWSRFLKLMAADKTKYLIPCYKDIDAYDMPEEFAHLQAQDMGKVGAEQDLIRGIKKLLPKEEPKKEAVQQTVQAGPSVANYLKLGDLALEDGDWDKAKSFFDQALAVDAECADAYLGHALAAHNVKN
ncbi:MAG: TIR domain-containing protein, partial [Clostridia bacterium]|nr:TIR domain-containing protein [Clostridia bacterium]